MQLPSAKDLKKLAAACRAAGITSFEGGGIKFTLSDLPPAKRNSTSAKKAAPVDLGANVVESDELSADAMLFWSVGDPESTPEGAPQ